MYQAKIINYIRNSIMKNMSKEEIKQIQPGFGKVKERLTEQDKIQNARAFLYFLSQVGFNPYEEGRVMELIRSVPTSLAIHFPDMNPYLLSERVDYLDLDAFGIDGAHGKLEHGEIDIPKSLESDARFLEGRLVLNRGMHTYPRPSFDEFDTVLAFHDYEKGSLSQLYEMLNIDILHKVAGCMVHLNGDPEIDTFNKASMTTYKALTDYLNQEGMDLSFVHATNQKDHYYLIKKGL